MAYFSNGSEGSCFEQQCNKCKYGQRACPIFIVQSSFNYDAVNNEVATNILNKLVRNDGTCQMFEEFELELPAATMSLIQISNACVAMTSGDHKWLVLGVAITVIVALFLIRFVAGSAGWRRFESRPMRMRIRGVCHESHSRFVRRSTWRGRISVRVCRRV